MSEVNEAVERGFQWLREELGDFLGRVDLNHLDLSDIRYCMLGQTLGPDAYDDLQDSHGEAWLEDHGFVAYTDREYEELNQTWKEKVELERDSSE